MSKKILSVKNISKSFGSTEALKDISFNVSKGEVIGFLGPNGAGKTTTIRVITGFLSADKGDVNFKGRSVNAYRKSVLEEIGYLPENNPLFTNLRVDEYLVFSAKMKGMYDKSELRKIAKRCGVDNVLSKKIETLSKGYRQRVGLSKALIGDPDLLIMDEPTVGLDPNQKEEILKLIKKYGKDKTILFSSHILSEVSEVTERVIIINEGEIVASGNTGSLIKEHFTGSIVTIKVDADLKEFEKEIKKIKDVSEVKRISRGRPKFQMYEIHCSKPEEVSLEIYKIASSNKWNMTELHSESLGLEDLFKKLTK